MNEVRQVYNIITGEFVCAVVLEPEYEIAHENVFKTGTIQLTIKKKELT